jgi:ribosomal peptide maturation radical SAM protein 1
MLKISLINMPFANLGLPSIALTQLKSVLETELPGQVSVDILYLSHDFARYLGIEFYDYLTNSMESFNTGLGDWVFRQAAFPELADNAESYFRRYFPGKAPLAQRMKEMILQKRPGMDALMDELITRYEIDRNHIVGFTSMFMQNLASFAMARKLKQRNPEILTVIGGANCEFPMGGVLAERVKGIDYVFSGPALKSFPEFARHFIAGDLAKCRKVRGVLHKGSDSPKSGTETIGEDLHIDTPIPLDYGPFLDRFDQYFSDTGSKPVLPFETSRGCWWGERSHCTFCGLNGLSMGYRAMKPELALDLFKSLFRYSGRVSRLTSVDNILPKSYLKEVLPLLDTPRDMEIFYEVKADLSEEEIAVLARAGVKQIQPGIEALATSTLKLMKKGTTVFQNVKLLKLCALYGIKPHWNLLLGFPGEGAESYRKYVELLPLLVHLQPPSGAFPVRFDRFSPYFYKAKEYSLDLHPLDFYSMVYSFDDADLRNLAYYFADRNISADYFTTMAKWVRKVRAKVAEWQARWDTRKYHLPPRLYFKEGAQKIYDSRSGVALEHTLSPTGLAMLRHLARPTRMEDILKVFSPEGGFNAREEVALLQAKGLIFQESDRFFSLVLESEHGSQAADSDSAYALDDVRYAAKALYGGTTTKSSGERTVAGLEISVK